MKSLCLGTASWGWTVEPEVAWEILDQFYGSGGRYIDTACNYPINGDSSCFGAAVSILADWLSNNAITDLRIFLKVGSLTNIRAPDNDLSTEHLQSQIAYGHDQFGENLYCAMIHWDNRESLDEINKSCKILDDLRVLKIEFGISGIRHPDVYRQALQAIGHAGLHIQIKHNFVDSMLNHYMQLADIAPIFWAYGIAAGGFKLQPKDLVANSYAVATGREKEHDNIRQSPLFENLRKTIKNNESIHNIYHLSMAYAELEPALTGYIVAPSSANQMADILDFRNSIEISGTLASDIRLDSLNR